ncbi:MAG: argininosuccinate synthase [Verrucomicrobia bacterium]|nr:argininosuccinate synthase [Verrucomicrobiota bacterium]MCH8526766.1 argininosuccinate synthase [Kiritimatiellia bacterium]
MKIVLAYSGGLDTSIILKWLQEEYDAEVICYASDVGQQEELDGLEAKALKHGATHCYVDDVRAEFAKDFVYPMIRANAVYESGYLLGTSIARPLIAKRLVEIAHKHGATHIAHGATGKGNDQVRFELTAYALDPSIQVIAPWRFWKFKSRTELMEYAESRGIDIPVSVKKPYSMDRNLLHISYEGGVLEDPWRAPDKDMFLLTKDPEDAPDEAEEVVIGYEAGNAVSLNGEALSPLDLMLKLNVIAGKHGIGRVDIVENRYVGMKSRGVYETPAGTILYKGREAVEQLAMDREALHLRDSLAPKYAELVYNGYWFAPERLMLQAAVDEATSDVTGEARLRLYKGNVIVVGRRSPKSLYDEHVATFEKDTVYDQQDAHGFIRLNSLRLRMRANRQG